MSRFLVSSEVAELLPRLQVVVVIARGLDNSGENPKVASHVQNVANSTVNYFEANKYANAQSHPRIALYRNTLKDAAQVSSKKYPQSNESLIKRVIKEKKAPRPISPAVDFYNSISIEHVVTAGAFDLEALKSMQSSADNQQPLLELRVAKVDEDKFVPLDSANGEPTKVDAKEILYAQGAIVLTRHMAWKQSVQGLVKPETKEIMFMNEVFDDASEFPSDGQPSELARSVAQGLQNGLKEYFGVDSTVEYLGKKIGKLEMQL